MKRAPFLVVASAALAAAAASAPALAQSFTANEGTIPGATPNLVNADRTSFNYEARIVQTITGALDGVNDPFVESGYLTKGSFATLGSAVPSQLNSFGAGGYGIYGLFNITGSATGEGSGIHATFQTATLTLFVDPGQNTTFGFTGNTAARFGTTSDDFAVANYTLQVGESHVFGGLANGDFDTIMNMTLTPEGQAFFSSPRPFYALENFGGNTQTLTGASMTQSFVATATGAGAELFVTAVPEPSTYAMMLAGIGALGFLARRRRGNA